MPPGQDVTLKEYMDFRFTKVDERLDAIEKIMEKKVDPIVAIVKAWRYIMGLMAIILVAIATRWISQLLGLS